MLINLITKGEKSMKNKLSAFIARNEEKMIAATTVATAGATYLAVANTACAAGASAADIADLIAKILGGGATVMGAIRTIAGFVSYANAQDDSNGPEMKKAEGKISSGVILGAVGLVIIGMSSTIAGWMVL